MFAVGWNPFELPQEFAAQPPGPVQEVIAVVFILDEFVVLFLVTIINGYLFLDV